MIEPFLISLLSLSPQMSTFFLMEMAALALNPGNNDIVPQLSEFHQNACVAHT